MRAFNVLLTLLVTLAIVIAVVEGGLRLVGVGPQPTIHRFDPALGWSKEPGASARRKSSEFDVRFEINDLGLRDDALPHEGKPTGTYRVLVLGDSFVLGYTVDRDNLFVDLLERWWKEEGRKVDVLNGGTEGWSTDQEVLWFLRKGRDFSPDLVLLCPYENDLYWNGQTKYLRYPKPRFQPSGQLEQRQLFDPGPRPWWEGFAVGKIAGALANPPLTWRHPANEGRRLPMEFGAYFREPPDFMKEAYERTRGALSALGKACGDLGIALRVVPIPNKACVDDAARKELERAVGVDPALWSPDLPVDTFLAMCRELSLAAYDPRPALRAAASQGPLYFQKDWHFDPAGNRAFASFLHATLDADPAVFPEPFRAQKLAELPPPPPAELPGWIKLYGVLLVVLSSLYALTYRDEPVWTAPLKVGALLALVFAIALGGSRLLEVLPPPWPARAMLVFVAVLIGFILFKLGRRLGTITELFAAFTRRGHWYLMPLVVVLLTIGSLLVVAASSPLVAPFIYTLF